MQGHRIHLFVPKYFIHFNYVHRTYFTVSSKKMKPKITCNINSYYEMLESFSFVNDASTMRTCCSHADEARAGGDNLKKLLVAFARVIDKD